jgi:hypothetical protein
MYGKLRVKGGGHKLMTSAALLALRAALRKAASSRDKKARREKSYPAADLGIRGVEDKVPPAGGLHCLQKLRQQLHFSRQTLLWWRACHHHLHLARTWCGGQQSSHGSLGSRLALRRPTRPQHVEGHARLGLQAGHHCICQAGLVLRAGMLSTIGGRY